MDGNAIVNHLIKTLTQKIGLDLKDWVATMQDRAKTNGKALREIANKTLEAHPSRADCNLHTLNNTANEMIGKQHTPYCDLFRK